MLYRFEQEKYVLEGGKEFHVVRHPDLPGCHGFGATFDEAMERLGQAREAYLETLKEMGVQPPASSIETLSGWWPANASIQGEQMEESGWFEERQRATA